ncbi:winged helix-turn-helix transcriptional regulator [Rhodococcus triatomae]|nr:hypothetical protein G419_16965 [Rhodococcus triatomae BKS 15-14]
MPPPNTITEHVVEVYRALRDADGWLTPQEIADRAGISNRSALRHASRLVAEGLAELVETVPYRYRLAGPQTGAFHARMAKIAAALGTPLDEPAN